MKKMLLVLAMSILPPASQAQDEAGEAAQRERIAAERSQAEAAFQDREKECYRKFAVTDCLNAAKAQRRQVLADLRRQEISLNDAQRKRKAAEHLRSIEQRSSPDRQRQQEEQRAKGLGESRERQAAAGEKAAAKAADQAGRADRAAAQQQETARRQQEAAEDRLRRAEEAAKNVKQRNERLAKAQERKASRDKRLAERRKPFADPLPPAP